LAHFQAALKEFEKSIQSDDLQSLHQLIQSASQARAQWRLLAGDDSDAD
jgi:hypothetical protein